MKHSHAILGKDLYDLGYSDMEAFFQTEKEESLNLEFKSFPTQGDYSSKENAIKKAVCALLNSEGGVVIWGAPIETKHANRNTSAVGALTPFSSNLDRDRLINILSSTLILMPVGIRVQALKNNQDDSIFVIEVEKSIQRPHQFDNRYFVRLDGQSRVAPHYLISALMKSVDFPILRGHIRLRNIDFGVHNDLHFKKLLFNTSPFLNDININMRLMVIPGTIIINAVDHGPIYTQTYPIISNGAPLLSNFILRIPPGRVNEEIRIIFQFGGEKSPSKISSYKFQLPASIPLGNVSDDSIYLIEKTENRLPSETSSNSDDENIDILLRQ